MQVKEGLFPALLVVTLLMVASYTVTFGQLLLLQQGVGQPI